MEMTVCGCSVGRLRPLTSRRATKDEHHPDLIAATSKTASMVVDENEGGMSWKVSWHGEASEAAKRRSRTVRWKWGGSGK